MVRLWFIVSSCVLFAVTASANNGGYVLTSTSGGVLASSNFDGSTTSGGTVVGRKKCSSSVSWFFTSQLSLDCSSLARTVISHSPSDSGVLAGAAGHRANLHYSWYGDPGDVPGATYNVTYHATATGTTSGEADADLSLLQLLFAPRWAKATSSLTYGLSLAATSSPTPAPLAANTVVSGSAYADSSGTSSLTVGSSGFSISFSHTSQNDGKSFQEQGAFTFDWIPELKVNGTSITTTAELTLGNLARSQAEGYHILTLGDWDSSAFTEMDATGSAHAYAHNFVPNHP